MFVVVPLIHHVSFSPPISWRPCPSSFAPPRSRPILLCAAVAACLQTPSQDACQQSSWMPSTKQPKSRARKESAQFPKTLMTLCCRPLQLCGKMVQVEQRSPRATKTKKILQHKFYLKVHQLKDVWIIV